MLSPPKILLWDKVYLLKLPTSNIFQKSTPNFVEHWNLPRKLQGKFSNSIFFFFRVPSSFHDFNNCNGYPDYLYWWHVTVYLEGDVFKIETYNANLKLKYMAENCLKHSTILVIIF